MFLEAHEALSNLLWASAVRLRELIERNSYDRVFFLSREGLILFRAYVALHGERPRPPMSYLLASRRSLGLATCWRLRDCYRLLNVPFHPQPLAQLLESRFGVAAGQVSDEELVVSRHEKVRIRSNLRKHRLQILQRANMERGDYLTYLRSRGMCEGGRYLLVDIGYNGTYHRAFERLLPNAEFESYCIAAFPGAAALVKGSRMHLLLPGVRDNRLKKDAFSRNVACVELMLMAPHPSFMYVKQDQAGRLRFTFDDRRMVPPREIRLLQRLAIERVEEAAKEGMGEVAQAIRTFEAWLSSPPLHDARAFGKLQLDDRYGGKVFRSAIATELLPAASTLTFEEAVRFYDRSEWKDGALCILQSLVIEAPATQKPKEPKSSLSLYKKVRKLCRSREAFRHHLTVFIQKCLRTYEAPLSAREVVAGLLSG